VWEGDEPSGRFPSLGASRAGAAPIWGALLCDSHAVVEVLVRYGRGDDPAWRARHPQPTAVLDHAFAEEHDLQATGTLRTSGGMVVRWVGHGTSPEYLTGSGQQGAFFGAGGYAVLYAPLEQAQRLARLPGARERPGARAHGRRRPRHGPG
jgi:hypothetical protein